MTTKEQLILLLYQIRGATSKLEKLKLAALAWRTLRGLDRRERLVVAKELGLGGAEHLVEQLGNQGGLSPSALLAAIRRAEDAEPEELRDLLGDVMDPERRDQLLAGALQSAGEWLAEQEELPPVPGAEEEPGLGIGVPDSTTQEAAAATGRTAMAAATVTDLVAATVPVGARSGAEAAAGTTATTTVMDPVTATVPATAAVTAATARAPAKAQSARSDHASRGMPQAREAVRPDGASTIIDSLESSPSAVRRLRLLASQEHRVAELSVDQLAEIVAIFPQGWSRRRALVALLNRGLPADIGQALELVQRVADDGSKIWVMTALAGRAGLTEVEKQMIEAETQGNPALERRVAVRLGRRRSRARRVGM